eukprot:967555-Prymnesium_polylepis.1
MVIKITCVTSSTVSRTLRRPLRNFVSPVEWVGTGCCPAHFHTHLRFTVRCPPHLQQLSTARAENSMPGISPPRAR